MKPKKSAYGLLAEYGPGPTEEEIDENRREMFSGFWRDRPVIAGSDRDGRMRSSSVTTIW